jgi:hypothetical protein
MGGGFGFHAGPGGRGGGLSLFGFIGKRYNYSAGWEEETRDTLAKELESRGLTPDDANVRREERRRRALALLILVATVAVVVLAWGLALWRG